jgi:transposase
MDAPECAGCRERDARIAELERRLAALEARLGTNSSNSSLPPSANPLSAKKPVVKKKTKRKRGGQPGHQAHLRKLLPPGRVNRVEAFVPAACKQCQAPLPQEAAAGDPEPTRFQHLELPPLMAVVTEYQGHARTCACCGTMTRAAIPRSLLQHSVGPRLAATLSYLSGCHGVSKRGVEEVAENVFDAPVSLGTVANLEQEVSAALAQPHQEAVAAVRAAAVKHADETSWKLAGKLCWLWAAAMNGIVAFVIHAKRGALGLAALLGQSIDGILCSDRWGVYEQVPPERRQICWAHLKRDFQKIIDRGGESVPLGRRGQRLIKRVFAAWHAFQDGQLTRTQLEEKLAPAANCMNRLLLEGWFGDDPMVATFCHNLLKLEPALWTFTKIEGVEPTNNYMERLLRRGVLWRKRSFGCSSPSGCRFVERILTVVQTCRLQTRNTLNYLQDALHAHRAGQPIPTLLAGA